MSREAAIAFIEKMKSDETFRARVMAVEDVATRIELVKVEGFDVAEGEIEARRAELRGDGLDRTAMGVVACFCKVKRHSPCPTVI